MGIKEMFQEWKEKQEEKRRFRNYVEKQTLPIRRKAYLEEKMKQAVKEGEAIAKKETEKYNKEENENFFGINTEPYFGEIKNNKNKKGGKSEWHLI